MSNNKRISDIIKRKDINSWEQGDYIMIGSPTGSGKSYFIKNKLYDYAVRNDKNILLLTNRNILKNQFIKELERDEKLDIITVVNYQKVETEILYGGFDFSQYDYVVLDEVHYIFSDSNFNENANLILNWLDSEVNNVVIFMSATNNLVSRYYDELIKHKYEIPQDYSYIDEVLFYESDDAIVKMLRGLPVGDKAMYFTGAKQAYETSKALESSSFICSQHNESFGDYIDLKEKKSIEREEKFKSKVLCCTTVLDNGINIVDEDVRHIVIDIMDLDTLQQCLGRKRIVGDNDSITLYIKDKGNHVMNGYRTGYSKSIEKPRYLRKFGEGAYLNKYKEDKNSPMIDEMYLSNRINYRVNLAMYIKTMDDVRMLNEMMSFENGYKLTVLDRLGMGGATLRKLEKSYDNIKIQEELDKFVGIKLFEEEKEEFMDFIKNGLFNGLKTRYGRAEINTINGYFEDNEYPYELVSKRERSRKSKNSGRWYWILSKKVYSVYDGE